MRSDDLPIIPPADPQWVECVIPTIEEMIAFLTHEGWTKYRNNPLVWLSPTGKRLMRGPAAAYWQARREKEI